MKHRIERKLLVGFLGFSLVPLLVIGFIGVRQMRQSLWEDMQGEIARDITEKEIALENLVSSYRLRLNIFSLNTVLQNSLIKFNGLSSSSQNRFRAEIKQRFLPEVESFLDLAGFVGLRISGKEGRALFDYRGPALGAAPSLTEAPGSASGRFVVNFVRNPGSPVYLSISGLIFENGATKNEAIGRITLMASTDEVLDILSTSVWTVFLFSQKGEVVAQLPPGLKRERVPEALIRKGLQGATGIEPVGEEVFVYRHLNALGGALVTIIEREEIFLPITQLTHAFGFGGLITAIVAILLSSYASRKMVRPVKTLLKSVDKVASGDFNSRVKIRSGDEIEVLADRFNEMLDEIKRRNEEISASKEAYRAIFESGADVRLFVGNDWKISRVNQRALQKVFGYHTSEVLGKPFDFLFTQAGALGAGEKDSFELALKRKEGLLFFAEVHWTDVINTKGEVDGSLITVRDVSEMKEKEDALKKSFKDLKDFKYALDQAAIVAITDPKGVIRYANKKFCEISKFRHDELIGQDHGIVGSGGQSRPRLKKMWKTIEAGEVWKGQFKNKARDGSMYWVDSTIVPFLAESGKPYQYLSIQTDITKRKEIEEEIRRLAHHDELTGLPNRALFNDRLRQAIKERSWEKRPCAVMFLDLDRFKIINDSLGHSAGDQLLRDVADRLTTCLRPEDTVARMGGDEFTVLLPVIAKAEDAFLVAQKMVAALKAPFSLSGKELIVTGSIGISLYPDNGEDAETLMKNADTAMYRAKKNGRGKFTFYSPAIKTTSASELEMESDLSHALERKELLLHYQPLVSLENGRIIGMEALIRWQRNGVMVPPDAFISLAEDTGLILPIGDWVLRSAMAQLRSWREAGFSGLTISVNVAPPQFQEPDFVESLSEMMREIGIAEGELKLELTESLLMKKQDEVIARLRALKALGVALAIDDFGTGYSSLSYLKRFPVDSLKIDRSFVQHLPEDQDDAAISEMIITLAYHLGLNVVAEGIETEAQLLFLKKLGCDVGQGYFFGRPLSQSAFTELLNEAFRPPAVSEPISRKIPASP